MTAKKKTLIELMLDAGVKPSDINSNTKYFVSDEPDFDHKTSISEYSDKPIFNKNGNDWLHNNFIKYICKTPYHPKNWKRTIITKQQFVDAYDEKHKPIHESSKVECYEIKFNPSALNNGKVILTPSHYSVIEGKDLIARSSESYKVDEFRGAMRFNIEKYIDRLGKKDSLLKELRKIADYANRWADYEEKLQGSK